ncbi:hypothetical protein GCM10007913_06660 [Devosia yakushimensis]|uniref:DUF1795 domain-containing protein n=2 Tax=Devosia yakushimensis TaxID=470028 RepID=A0ABQ5U9E2_9HYPH|nr:hypothetical protein GCM10007913_06660 [Devosia yakushimensis]
MRGGILLVALASALVGAPMSAGAASDIWHSAAGPDGIMRYSCDDACAQTQVICVHEVIPEPGPGRVEDLVDEALVPWGQIDFSVAARIAGDRENLAGAGKIVDGKRIEGPAVVSFGGSEWASARYAMESKGGGLAAQFLLWRPAEGVATLLCSHKAGVDDAGAEVAIRQLAESLRLTP